MKKFIMTGAMPAIKKGSDIYENWVKTGNNTGNLFIGYAVKQELGIKENFPFHHLLNDRDVDYIQQNFDAVVIASSNFINPYQDFGYVAQNIKRIKLPVITLGIGAQASDTKTANIKLKDGTKDFVYALSEYGHSIGVRGEFTAEVLKNLGIKNYEVIGCPTYYINKNPKFKINHKAYKNFEELNISYNYTHLNKEVDQKLVKIAFQSNSDVIGQMEYIEDYWKNKKVYKAETLTDATEKVMESWHLRRELYKSFIDDFDKFKEYLQKHFYMFYDIPEWISYIKKYDYTVGTRFHGCMLAVQNYIPALLITHDSRTSELASFCNIPHLPAEKFMKVKSFQDILDMDIINYDKFNKEYEQKFYYYVEFLRKNGVSNIEQLFGLPQKES